MHGTNNANGHGDARSSTDAETIPRYPALFVFFRACTEISVLATVFIFEPS